MGMFCTKCAETADVFHKMKKHGGEIVDNRKENPVLCIDRAGWEILLTVGKAGGEREIEKRL